MTANTLFVIIITIFIADFLFSRYLSFLNIKSSSEPIPTELKDIYNEEQYIKQQQYFRANSKFSMIVSSFNFIITLCMLFGGFWWLNRIVISWGLTPMLSSMVFFGILYIANDLIALPFDIYDTFVIEDSFGFNKITAKTFILDKIKGYLLVMVVGGGLLFVIMTIYFATPNYFWLLAWLVVTVFGIFMSLFYSDLIVPLFNKQKPLEDGDLRDKINDFAQKSNFKLKNIYTIDGSKRSTKANAYFTGIFGKKRIVLYDTLIEKLTVDEIVSVLSHEIGHYKHRHTLKTLLVSLPSNLLLFFLLGIILKSNIIAQSIGCSEASFHINIIVFGILYTPISTILDMIHNVLSRRAEYQADNFTKQYGMANELISSLKKLSATSLSNLTPNPIVVFVNYSHPTLYQRIINLLK